MSSKKKQVRAAFRNAVYTRDKYTCRCCGFKGDENTLDAHHIIDRNEMPNGGYVKENGITVCSECHIKAESTHLGLPIPEGYSREDLFRIIGSSEEIARRKS